MREEFALELAAAFPGNINMVTEALNLTETALSLAYSVCADLKACVHLSARLSPRLLVPQRHLG